MFLKNIKGNKETLQELFKKVLEEFYFQWKAIYFLSPTI